MKNKIYFLSILILFQSCNSYKVINLKTYDLEKSKKVKVILKNAKRYDGKLIDIREDEIILQNFKRKKIISIADIDKIKQPEFSILKTLGLTFIISLAALVSSLAYFTNGFK
tara:strand:- start:139 stop:474 length:336 start_codon:yes stop_codon:yes gene_type:complete